MDISSLRERASVTPFSVGELNSYIKNVIESDRNLAAVTVKGEISNFVAHTSGHLYFSLKDETGQIKAVMFRTSATRLKFVPENGMKVTAHGSVSVYSQGGTYQLYVNSLSPDGVGALYLAYERLKAKLDAEGLFSEYHKKPIPRFPRSVGVITSPTGAAVRDIINVTGRRYPGAVIYLYPSLVQGEGAEDELIRALDYFERSGLADVIIIGRGGGSIEDLWAFNGERLARRIYSHSVPIISAVGHETDFTICDFVADMRAPTPSAAAEIAVPDVRELEIYLDTLTDRAARALKKCAERKRERLEYLTGNRIFREPHAFIEPKARRLDELYKELVMKCERGIEKRRGELRVGAERLQALSPLSVLSRGYAVLEKDGKTVKSVSGVKVGDELSLRLTDGTVGVSVTEKKKFPRKGSVVKNGN